MGMLGEVRWFANVGCLETPPAGFVRCDGRLLLIAEYPDLYSLLGTTYGGDGVTTFGVPDLIGSVVLGTDTLNPSGQPTAYPLGQAGGQVAVALTAGTVPAHGHDCVGQTTAGDSSSAVEGALPGVTTIKVYGGGSQVGLAPPAVTPTAPGDPHPNLQPYLPLTPCIVASGLYPSECSPRAGLRAPFTPDPVTGIVGEVRIMAGSAMPTNCTPCDGRALLISDYQLLFSVIGHTYDTGPVSPGLFQVPDLRGRVPLGSDGVGPNANYPLGVMGGVETVALSAAQGASHDHSWLATTATATATSPGAALFAATQTNSYGLPGQAVLVPLADDFVLPSCGASDGEPTDPHPNVMPGVAMTYVITDTGVLPAQASAGMDACIGEVRAFAAGAPADIWLPCDGRALASTATANQLLGAVIGALYGGASYPADFQVPSLSGQTVIGAGAGVGLTPRTLGQAYGSATVTLLPSQYPAHDHSAFVLPNQASSTLAKTPANTRLMCRTPGTSVWVSEPLAANNVTMAPGMLGATGGGGHDNMQPYLALNYAICLSSDYFPVPAGTDGQEARP